MPSGASVYRTLVRRMEDLETSIDETADSIEKQEQTIDSLQQRRAEAFLALARFHLPEMSAEAVAGTLAEFGDRAKGIFQEKQARTAELRTDIPKARAEIRNLRDELHGLTDDLNRIGGDRDRLRAEVDEELNASPGWDDLTARARTAHARTQAAERRYDVAVAERTEKLPAYDADTFFSYLNGRGFGTPEAKGNVLTRRLDAWVADVTGYVEAHQDYEVLQELPAYAEKQRNEERAALEQVSAELHERTAPVAERHGLTAVMQEGDEVYARREEVIEALRAAEKRHQSMEEELAAMDDTHGQYHERALEEIQDFLQSRTIEDLVAEAKRTEDARDDAIVADLSDVESALSSARKDLLQLRGMRTTQLKQLKDLRNLRHDFELHDWNGGRSRFSGGFDMDGLLLGYLAGRSSVSQIRNHVSNSQHFQAPSSGSWGSGGFGGGGGFSSGGGFGGGGGGFSTGGGF